GLGPSARVAGRKPAHQHRNAPLLLTLRPRGARPRGGGRAAEQRNEIPPSHSITSSARPSRPSGNTRPSAFAALRLITSSTLVACLTGRSDGFSPLRIRPV